MKIVGLDLTKEPGSRKVNLTLAFDSSPGMPQCKGVKVSTVLTKDSWLTAKGNLVQDSQEHKMRHYEFCVDLIVDDDDDTAEGFGAVSCEACTEEHPCVNLCCPHGTALVEDPDNEGMEICGTLNENFSPEFWTQHDMKMEEYGEKHGFILKAPATAENQFKCSKVKDSHIDDFLHLYQEFDLSSYTVTSDGRLHGNNISYQNQREAHFGNFSWDNDKFCVSYVDAEYEYAYDEETGEDDYGTNVFDGVFQFTFNACNDYSVNAKCQDHLDFLSFFNPISLCISIFFLILTIAFFIWYKNINAWDRGNMMKIAFLVNLTVAYIVSVSMWVQDNDPERLGTPGCKFVGYLLQHFFLGAIFWINAMGFHIWRLMNVGGSKKSSREDLKKFLKFALYAQGTPLLINIITAIIDSTRTRITPHYPNMGELRCFLGENYMAEKNYFRSAKFIYNDLFLFLVQFVNAFFLISIAKVLRRGWKHQAEGLKLKGEEKEGFQEQFRIAANHGAIVLRIFVILGK